VEIVSTPLPLTVKVRHNFSFSCADAGNIKIAHINMLKDNILPIFWTGNRESDKTVIDILLALL
jgi:hypothetical protein